MHNFRLYLIFAFLISGLLLPSYAKSGDTVDHDCIKCHQITTDEVMNIIKEGLPSVKVLEVRPGPVKGIWEVVVESRGQKGILYIDFSKQHLVSGAILNIKTRTNLTEERRSELNRVDISQIPLNEAIIMGDKNAPKKVIVFTDPD